MWCSSAHWRINESSRSSLSSYRCFSRHFNEIGNRNVLALAAAFYVMHVCVLYGCEVRNLPTLSAHHKTSVWRALKKQDWTFFGLVLGSFALRLSLY
jgi:hypothetical protein